MQGKQIKKGYLVVYQEEKVICDRRHMEVEIDVWEVRKLERSEAGADRDIVKVVTSQCQFTYTNFTFCILHTQV